MTLVDKMVIMQEIEECRAFWAKVAEENGWGGKRLYVQVWLNKDNVTVQVLAACRDRVTLFGV
jgi:hypothetical protein